MSHTRQHWKRSFALIWSGQVFSLLSSSAVNFAITIFLTLQYESAEVLAYATIAGLLPMALLGPFAGVFVDRWNKKYTMMLADGGIALCTALMAIAMMAGFDNLYFIYAMMALRAVGSAFHIPAMQASTPLLAPKEEFIRITGMNQGIQSISLIAGPALGGFLVGIFPKSLGSILMIDVIGAALAIVFLSFVKFPKHIVSKASSSVRQVFSEMKEGFQTIWSLPPVKWVFLYSIVVMFAVMPIISLLPLMTKSHFQKGVGMMALVKAAYPIGMMIGGLLLSVWKPKLHALKIASLALGVVGTICIISGLLPQDMIWVFVGLLVIIGIINTIEYATMQAFQQLKVPQEKLGRVMAINFSVSSLPSVAGLLMIGFLTNRIGGVGIVFSLCGAIILAIGIIQYLTPAIQKAIKEDETKDSTK